MKSLKAVAKQKEMTTKQKKGLTACGRVRLNKYIDTKDFHPTPPSTVKLLLERENFEGQVWDPCCGIGGVSSVLRLNKYKVFSSDLFDRGYKGLDKAPLDFLSCTKKDQPRRFKNVVCNPPFNIFMPFIEKALAITENKVAMLLPLNYLGGIARNKEIWISKRPESVYVISRTIEVYKGEKWTRGGMFYHMWVVWNLQRKIRNTKINWLVKDLKEEACK